MTINTIEVQSKKDLKDFINLPYKIYKDNKYWVPPLKIETKESLNPKINKGLEKINFKLFLAKDSKNTVGRLMIGIDSRLNKKKNESSAYFALFETFENQEIVDSLFDSGLKWLKENNMDYIRGPQSVTGADGDEQKGLLIMGYDLSPAFMNAYHLPYYKTLLENYGFDKDYDVFGYYLDGEKLMKNSKRAKVLEYAKRKYKFSIEPVNLKNLEHDMLDIKEVIEKSIPDEWPDLIPPSLEEIRSLGQRLKKFADPDIILLARSEGKPIAFILGMPDYYRVIKHMNGRVNPITLLKYFYYKRHIDFARLLVMFVVPEFRTKGVSQSIYYQTLLNGKRKGYINGESSTIGEENIKMRRDIEKFGAEHYKTYRIMGKKI